MRRRGNCGKANRWVADNLIELREMDAQWSAADQAALRRIRSGFGEREERWPRISFRFRASAAAAC